MTAPDRLDTASLDIAAEHVERLREDFPEVFQDGKIDFDALKRSLGEWVDPGKERFGLTWPGKAACMRTIQQPSTGTLRPDRAESVDFDTTQNVIIEGENLEVLKLLQKSYYGKVKMIYIDPPYNTGNDFVYPDDFREPLANYLRLTGQVGDDGARISTNSESGGRFHSNWLNMMYPRLFLARNLLREDGVIMVSIDDNETLALRALLNEIFGEQNFVAQLAWSGGRKNDSKYISVSHEYVMIYVKDLDLLKRRAITWRQRKEGIEEIYAEHDRLKEKFGSDYRRIETELGEWYAALPDDHPSLQHRHYRAVDWRGVYFPDNISWPGGGGPRYEVLHPVTGRPCRVPSRGWLFPTRKRMQEVIDDDRVQFGETEDAVPTYKAYLKDREYQVPYSVFYQDGRASTKRLRSLFSGVDVFEHPKDEVILGNLVEFATDKDALVLDFFAGSGTTAHAVMKQNAADDGDRRYILVQLPEPTEGDYPTISAITRERVRRAGEAIAAERAGKLDLDGAGPLDLGFRAYHLAESSVDITPLGRWLSGSARGASADRAVCGQHPPRPQ